jgi:3-hydroxymyristoyl/3-hydroxydecanoyl-(acyl carrier protein) dehydratase
VVDLAEEGVRVGPEHASALVGSLQVRESSDAALVTEYTVAPDEPVLVGHFPGFPIFPGVCLLECAYRTAAIALTRRPDATDDTTLVEVESVRFLRPVFPGDRVRGTVTVTETTGGWRCQVEQSAGPGAGESVPVAVFRLRFAPAGPARTIAAADPALAGTGQAMTEEGPAPAGTGRAIAGPGPAADPGAASPTGPALTLPDIKRLLPHRYPMLLVDRVHQLEPGVSLTASKLVTANEPCYAGLDADAGHAYPTSLLVESWCQAAGVLACLAEPNPDVLTGRVTLFGSISRLELPAPVHPGDEVRHHVRVVRLLSDAAVLQGESRVGDRTVLRVASVVIALRPAGTLTAPTAGAVPTGPGHA